MTRDRIFLGAFVKAYSRPVILAKISEKAIKTYALNEKISQMHVSGETPSLRSLNPDRSE